MLIQTFIAKLTVKALDESVLPWFAGLDVVPLEAPGRPSENRRTGKFRPIVADNNSGRDALSGQSVENSVEA